MGSVARWISLTQAPPVPAPSGRQSPLAIPSYSPILANGCVTRRAERSVALLDFLCDDQLLDLVGAFVDLQQPDSGTSCALALRAAIASGDSVLFASRGEWLHRQVVSEAQLTCWISFAMTSRWIWLVPS